MFAKKIVVNLSDGYRIDVIDGDSKAKVIITSDDDQRNRLVLEFDDIYDLCDFVDELRDEAYEREDDEED